MAEFGEQLSDRELEVLQWMSTGAGNKQIAAELSISQNTVKVHLRNIYVKLGATSRTEAMTKAMVQGILLVPEDASAADVGVEGEPVLVVANPGNGVETSADLSSPTVEAIEEPAAAHTAVSPWRDARTLAVVVLLLVVVATAVWWTTRSVGTVNAPELEATPVPFEEVELSDNWRMSRPLPQALADMAAAPVGINLYLIGGKTASGETSNQVSVYNIIDQTWEEAAEKPTAVSETSAAELFGEIIVPGGRLADGSLTSRVEAYSPINEAWRALPALPHSVSGGLALSDGSFLYLIGGWDGSQYLDTTYLFDPGSGSWRPLPAMKTARAQAAGGVISGKLYVVGGYDGQQELATCEAFSPVESSWSDCPSMLTPRAGAGAAVLVNKLYVIGGGLGDGQPVANSEAYDPNANEWSLVNTPMLANDAAWTNMGVLNVETRIYAVGGRRSAGEPVADAYILNPLIYQTFIPAATSGD